MQVVLVWFETPLNNNGAYGPSKCYPRAECTLSSNVNMTMDCNYLEFVFLCLFSLALRPTIWVCLFDLMFKVWGPRWGSTAVMVLCYSGTAVG